LREVGKELGVNHETLRNWVTATKGAEAGWRDGAESISADEREELRRLRKKVAEPALAAPGTLRWIPLDVIFVDNSGRRWPRCGRGEPVRLLDNEDLR
jgi:hypothetical protein